MEKVSNIISHATAGLAALALTLSAVAVTVSPVDFAAPTAATQEMVA